MPLYQTTTTVNTLTGAQIGSARTTGKLLQAPVWVKKFIENGVALIQFKVGSRGGIDKSEATAGTTAFAKKDEFLKALKLIGKKQLEQRFGRNSSDSTETVYDDGDITLHIITSGKEAYGELIINDVHFVLSYEGDIKGLSEIIYNLK